MRILLIYPDHLPGVKNYKGYFYQGLASIAATLLKGGHKVRILHQIELPNHDDYAVTIKEFAPQIVALSSTSNQFSIAHDLACWSRELLPEVLIVCGGVHATLNADQIIKLSSFDLVCLGEGEYPMSQLADRVEKGEPWDDIPGMWVRKKDGSIQRNSLPPLVEDLDSLPWPNRDLWNYPALQMESEGLATVMLSRGCNQRCTYCCNQAISEVYRDGGLKGRYFRIRSVDSSIAELKAICDNYPFIRAFNFDDDNFFVNLIWAREFTERYVSEIGLPFTCNLFPGLINEERVALLKKAGCIDLRIGLESGNEEIRKKILGRNISDKAMRQVYHLCQEAGILTRSFVMVGIPEETPAMVLDTIKFIAYEKVGVAQYSIFSPFRKTTLHKLCIEKGYIQNGCENDEDYYSSSMLDMPTLTQQQILLFRNYFLIWVTLYRTIDKLPAGLSKNLTRMLDTLLIWKYTPPLLVPLSFSLKVIKRLVPSQLNKNQLHLPNSIDREP